MIPSMALIVQKYGGTSVGSLERIQAVAQRVLYTRSQGAQVVVVVSAMAGETDRLLQLSTQLAPTGPWHPDYERELDMVLSTGEQVSVGLLAMALQRVGCSALSMTAAQVGIRTSKDHTRARILEINTDRMRRHLEQGDVVVVTGFQGVTSLVDPEITTLGRGGSDTTAVAVAVALQADVCEIYTDVRGVFTTDPRRVPAARLLPEITSAEMLELASLGAKVLHPRAVELARNFGMKLRVLSSLEDPLLRQTGTLVLSTPVVGRTLTGLEVVQAVDRVELDRDQVKVVLLRVPDRPGVAAQLFQTIATAGINVDLILQSIHTTEGMATNDIAFTVPQEQLTAIQRVTPQMAQDLECPQVLIEDQVAKISIGGAGMIGRPGIAADMFRVLAEAGINLQMISMSEIKVSCIIAADQAGDAALLLGEAFQVIPRSHHQPASISTPSRPVRGVALDENQARLAILQVPDQPGTAALIFGQLATAGIQVDSIIQSQRRSPNSAGIPTNDMAFTVPQGQALKAASLLRDLCPTLACGEVVVDEAIAKVSIVGSEMESHPGVAAQMFAALATAGINIEMIATSEIKISCVVRQEDGPKALQLIHEVFRLDQE
jgi:aspartate kinase